MSPSLEPPRSPTPPLIQLVAHIPDALALHAQHLREGPTGSEEAPGGSRRGSSRRGGRFRGGTAPVSPGGQHRKICAPEGAKGATRRALQRAFACAATPGRFFIHSKVARKSAIPVLKADLSLPKSSKKKHSTPADARVPVRFTNLGSSSLRVSRLLRAGRAG
jgi:hypothetical protein